MVRVMVMIIVICMIMVIYVLYSWSQAYLNNNDIHSNWSYKAFASKYISKYIVSDVKFWITNLVLSLIDEVSVEQHHRT